MDRDQVAAAGNRVATPTPGELVDHFKILRRVSGGAMGEVYLARDARLGRRVAIKVLTAARLASATARDRFWAEARITAQFSHPNIVVIHAFGEHQGLPYLALEYVEGESLRERLARERPAPGEVLRFGLAMAEALKEAHRHQVVHRDLKPENVVIPLDGRLRVLDFGVALSAAVPDGGNLLCGTPAYMAPEQWLGTDVDGAADVWALGVVLHELCTGRAPFAGATSTALRTQICDPAPAPRVPPSVEPRLARLIEQCLDKQARRRPSAEQICTQLRAMLEGRRSVPDETAGPFRGLRPFDEGAAGGFFGRDADVAAFVECLRSDPVVGVVGPSGSGKSSFVQAGVLPRLREAAHHIVLSLRPGADPFASLAQALSALQSGSSPPASAALSVPRVVADTSGRDPAGARAETLELPSLSEAVSPAFLASEIEPGALAATLRETPGQLAIMLTALAETTRARVFLFVDQIEELCALVEDGAVQSAFLQALMAAADDPAGPVRVVFTLRDDFLGRLVAAAGSADPLRRVFVLRPPDREILKEVLTEPLRPFGYSFEDEAFAEEIVDAVTGATTPLALLQFTAEQLWQRRDRAGRRLLRATYQALGGVTGALADHADRLLEGISAAQVQLVRELLLRLITPNGTRRVLSRPRLLDGLTGDAAGVLERLIVARLLSSRKGERDETVFELAHESLIFGWKRLARWIDEGREDRAALDDLRAAAELWDRRGRSRHELWQGEPLDQARRLLGRTADAARKPNVVRGFVDAGNAQERGRARRRRLAVALAMGALAAGSVVLWRQWRLAERSSAEARVQEARARLETADRTLATEPWSALASLRSAVEIADPGRGQIVWWHAQGTPLRREEQFASTVWDVTFAPSGQTLVAGTVSPGIHRIALDGTIQPPLTEEGGPIRRLVYSPDGTRLGAGGFNELRVWDLATGSSRRFSGHTAMIWGLAFSPDGTRLASTAWDKTLRIWDLGSAALVRTVPLAGVGLGVAFSPDGKLLAFADTMKDRIRIQDARTGAELAGFGPHTTASRLAFAPDGTTLVTAGIDRTVRIWEVGSRRLLHVLRGHTGSICQVAIDPSGRLIASAGADKLVRVWDFRSGRALHELRGHKGEVCGVAFSPDGGQLATSSLDGDMRIWKLGPSTRIDGRQTHKSMVFAVAFDPSGRLVASGSDDESVRIWEVASGESVMTLEGHKGSVDAMAFFPGGDVLVTAGEDKRVRLWRTSDGSEGPILAGHLHEITAVAVSPEGKLIAASGADGGVRIWSVPAGWHGNAQAPFPTFGPPRLLTEHKGPVNDLAFAPDGQSLATASDDGTVQLWDTRSWRRRKLLGPHRGQAQAVTYSPDGRKLAVGGDAILVIHDLVTGQAKPLGDQADGASWLAFSPDGRKLAVAGQGVTLWDLERGARSVLSQPAPVWESGGVAFSPDGRTLAFGDETMVKLWDVVRDRPLWRAPVLLKRPARILTAGGWRRLDGIEDGGPPAFVRAAAEDARVGDELDGSARALCLQKYDGRLERWDETRQERTFATTAPTAARLIATARGCLVLAGGEARLFTGAPTSEALGPATAANYQEGEILLAREGEVRILDDAGAAKGHIPLKGRPTAVARVGAAIAWAADRDIHFSPPRTPRLQHVDQGEVTALAAGPAETLAAAFTSPGTLNQTRVWDLRDGTEIWSAPLHGPTAHLAFVDGTLHIASTLGGYRSVDFSGLAQSYCDMVREVWREVPVVWDNKAIPRPPPRDHVCSAR